MLQVTIILYFQELGRKYIFYCFQNFLNLFFEHDNDLPEIIIDSPSI
jgi:hypothetical protein